MYNQPFHVYALIIKQGSYIADVKFNGTKETSWASLSNCFKITRYVFQIRCECFPFYASNITSLMGQGLEELVCSGEKPKEKTRVGYGCRITSLGRVRITSYFLKIGTLEQCFLGILLAMITAGDWYTFFCLALVLNTGWTWIHSVTVEVTGTRTPWLVLSWRQSTDGKGCLGTVEV